MPKHNADYWIPKFERNVQRDAEKRVQLETAGWTVITIWECEMEDMDSVMEEVTGILENDNHGRQCASTLEDWDSFNP